MWTAHIPGSMTGTQQAITALSLVSMGAWLHRCGTQQCQLRTRGPHHSWPCITGREPISHASCLSVNRRPFRGPTHHHCVDQSCFMKAGNSLVYSPKIKMLEENYIPPSVVRAHYLWWAAVGGSTSHWGQTPLHLLKFQPSCWAGTSVSFACCSYVLWNH